MLYPTRIREPRRPEPVVEQDDQLDFVELPRPITALLNAVARLMKR